jgi:hypothetical protein
MEEPSQLRMASTGVGPAGIYAWMTKADAPGKLAGSAFLLAPDIAVTCAHVVRDHLGLGKVTPDNPPSGELLLRFPALDCERKATVIPRGWYASRPEGGARKIRDLALLQLTSPIEDPELSCIALASTTPPGGRKGRILGAGPGWQEHEQDIPVELAGATNAQGRWQLTDLRNHGFSAVPGYSGSPLFGESMTVIWGMVQQVGSPEERVTLALGADRLHKALQDASIGLVDRVRLAGEAEAKAEAAMRNFISARESQWAEKEARRERELSELRLLVANLASEKSAPNHKIAAEQALQGLAEGNAEKAQAFLSEEIDRDRKRGQEAFQSAASKARQLGVLLQYPRTPELRWLVSARQTG